ncbi:MAG: fibronectin type III domain-containing protein [Gammaproteobacteria bacterium]
MCLVRWLSERVLLIVLCVCSGLAVAREPSTPAPPALSTDAGLSTAGYYRLAWEPAQAGTETQFELQRAATADFTAPVLIYTGPDRASSFSGNSNGTYYFRVRETGAQGAGAWSTVISVQVEHHSLARAGMFFGLGALVFVATLALILRGPREDRGA